MQKILWLVVQNSMMYTKILVSNTNLDIGSTQKDCLTPQTTDGQT